MRKEASMTGPASVEPQFFEWNFPGGPVRILLSLDIVPRIWEHLAGSSGYPLEAGGLLLGTVKFNRVRITGFEPFPLVPGDDGRFVIAGEDRVRFGALIEKWADPGAASRVIGYFRGQIRDELRLHAEDLALIDEFFPDPKSVFLIVQGVSGGGTATAGFFFWDNGKVFADLTFMPFPFDSSLLTAGDRRLLGNHEASAAPSVDSIDLRATKPVAVFLRGASTLAAVAAAILLFVLSAALYRTTLKPSSASKTAVLSSVPASALSLSVSRSGSDVEITWNSAAPPIKGARVGVLTIQDGNNRRELSLTAQMLHDSRIVFTPVSTSINVALELFDGKGKRTAESVIVLLNGTSETVASNPGGRATPRQATPAVRVTVPLVAAKDANPGGAPPRDPAAETQVATPKRMLAIPPLSADARSSVPDPDVFDAPVVVTAPQSVLLPQAELVHAQTSAPAPPPVAPLRIEPQPVPVIVPPRVIRQTKPELPANVRNMVSQAVEIRVKATVDASGRVTKAEPLETKGALEDYLGTAGAAAARVWKFEPARQDGRPVSAEVVLQFRFAPEKKQ